MRHLYSHVNNYFSEQSWEASVHDNGMVMGTVNDMTVQEFNTPCEAPVQIVSLCELLLLLLAQISFFSFLLLLCQSSFCLVTKNFKSLFK